MADDEAAYRRVEAARMNDTLLGSIRMLSWLNTGNGIVAKNTAR
jgi:hypothetical protein